MRGNTRELLTPFPPRRVVLRRKWQKRHGDCGFPGTSVKVNEFFSQPTIDDASNEAKVIVTKGKEKIEIRVIAKDSNPATLISWT
jgi:hypothetical protein